MDSAKDYTLAQHLITHLQQDAVLAPLVCPAVWDDQDQVDAINRASMGRAGSIAVTPAGYVPLLDIQGNAPMVRMYAVLAVSCFGRTSAAGLQEGCTTLAYLSGMVTGVLRTVRSWDPVVDRICYDSPIIASVDDYDMTKSKLTGYRGKAVILMAPVNF